MEFTGSTSYYFLCIIALVLLVSILIILQKKPKSKAKPKADHQQSNSEYIPKYAAGDEMDKINRKAYALWSEKKFSLKEIPIMLIGIIFVFTVLISEQKNTKLNPSQTPTISSPEPQTTPMMTPNQTPTGELSSDFISAEFNNDYTKLFATYSYTNNFNINIYSIVATIELKDENDNVIQTKVADTIESLKPGEIKEITTSVTIEPNNINKVKNVTIHTTFLRNK